VICTNQAPDATVARFRVRHSEALAELFGQVLGLCTAAGLVRAGVIAVDGSKFAAAVPACGVGVGCGQSRYAERAR
jgi:transposase